MSEKELYKVICYQFPTREKRFKFLGKCTLTFGLRKETLVAILGLKEEELIKEILKHNSEIYLPLKKVLYYGVLRQEVARDSFTSYILRLANANKIEDKEKRYEDLKKLRDVLSDKAFIETMKKRQNVKTHFTEEEMVAIMKYQVKYMIGIKELEDYYGIAHTYYARNYKALKERYPLLVDAIEAIADINTKLHYGKGIK